MEFDIPLCGSLKEKRSIIKPFCHRLHREFNISVSEMGDHDFHHRAIIVAAKVANDRVIIEREFSIILNFTNQNFPDLTLINHSTEYF